MKFSAKLGFTQYLCALSATAALILTIPVVSNADDHERKEHLEKEEELDKHQQEIAQELERAHKRHDRVAIINLEHKMRVLESERHRRAALHRLKKEEEREHHEKHDEGNERHIDELHEHIEELHEMLEEMKEEIDELRELAEEHEEDDED